MSKATVHWSPGEASLGRASLNSILGGVHRRMDITEEMMRSATIGRSSELGPGWEPPGMVSRKIASILTAGGRRADDNSAQARSSHRQVAQYIRTLEEREQAPQAKVVASAARVEAPQRPLKSCSATRLPTNTWQTMAQCRRSPSAALLAAGSAAAGPKSEQEAATSARNRLSWQPKDPSLERESFNAMCRNQKCDVTEVMMRNAMMGKAAMMGPEWDPPGIVSRKIAEVLSKQN